SEPDDVTVADAAHDATRFQRGIERRTSGGGPSKPIGRAPRLAIDLAATVEVEADIDRGAARSVEVGRALRARGQPEWCVEGLRIHSGEHLAPAPVVRKTYVVRRLLLL